jgi:hypothetical protein
MPEGAPSKLRLGGDVHASLMTASDARKREQAGIRSDGARAPTAENPPKRSLDGPPVKIEIHVLGRATRLSRSSFCPVQWPTPSGHRTA